MKTNPNSIYYQYAFALKLQMLYGFLCACWNLVVIAQVKLNVVPIGPTGSWWVVFGALLLPTILYQSLLRNREGVYLLVSVIVGLVAIAAIYSGLTGRSELWPSRHWQLMGSGVNLLGLITVGFVGAARFRHH